MCAIVHDMGKEQTESGMCVNNTDPPKAPPALGDSQGGTLPSFSPLLRQGIS